MPTRDPLLKRKPQKTGGRKKRSTVLADQKTIEAVCLAELGKGNDLLRTKAKTAAGYGKGDGFRRAWREGRSQYEDVVNAVLPQLKKDYVQNILPQVEHPLPKVAPKEDE
jgi:hypothetical protein